MSTTTCTAAPGGRSTDTSARPFASRYKYDKNICLGKVVSDGVSQSDYARWSHGEGFGLTSDGRWGVGAFLHESFADEPGDPECTSGYCKEQGGTSPVDFAQ